MISHLPIVIVGAGPVGLMTAYLLVQGGHPVLVLEKNSGLARDLRGSVFHPATLDLLEPPGLAEPLIAGGSISQAWQIINHAHTRHAVFDLELITGQTRHPYALSCEQFHLTGLLLERLERNPLFDIRFNHEVTGLQTGQDGVRLQVAWPDNEAEWSAEWLIAADGGGSAVRRFLGLPFRKGELSRTSVTLVLDYPFQLEVEGLLGVNYFWAEHANFSLLQIRDLWRLTHSPPPGMTGEEAALPGQAQAFLRAAFPNHGPYRILQSKHYSQGEHCMDDFRHGRVLFAGDAAHLCVPVGGMGMNSGIQDAFCLAEHLLPVLEGADEERLDRYSRRRRTIAVEEVQRLSGRMYRWAQETDPERREETWAGWMRLLEDPERSREFLLETSMIRSLRREREIA